MAFVQQRRRAFYRSNSPPLFDPDDTVPNSQGNQAEELSVAETSLVLSPGIIQPASSCPSDSDGGDWHFVKDSQSSSSPKSEPSEPDSLSSFRPSDAEFFSDLDGRSSSIVSEQNETSPTFRNLPSHDGTGTFVVDTGFCSDSASHDETGSPAAFARVVRRLLDNEQLLGLHDFEPESESMPNILLPHGGIRPPSFTNASSQSYRQTSRGHLPATVQATTEAGVSQKHSSVSFAENVPSFVEHLDEEQLPPCKVSESTQTSTGRASTTCNRRRRRNLDSIPTHHPTIPGTLASFTILSTVWSHLRQLTTHLIENETNSSETLSSLISEAAIEGCLPFSSHLHMDFGPGVRPPASRIEGVQWLL